MTLTRSKRRLATAAVGALICACGMGQLVGAQPQGNASQQNQSPQLARVSGHITRADTGAPLGKAIVTLSGGQTQTGGPQTQKSETTRTAQDGSFSFGDIPPGTYSIRIDRTGYVSQSYGQVGAAPTGANLRVSAGQTVDNIDVHLSPAGVISGTVFDEDNEPLEGIGVSAIRLRFTKGGQETETTVNTTRTDDLGNYRLSGLSPGKYYVRTGTGRVGTTFFFNDSRTEVSYGTRYYPGTRSLEGAQRIQVTSGAEARGIQITVNPDKTYKIAGTIVDATEYSGQRRYSITAARVGEPDPAVMNSPGGVIYTIGDSPIFSASIVNPDGAFVLDNVPSGDYLLTARAVDQNPQGGRGTPARLDVGNATVRVSDGDAHVTVQIGRASEVRGQAFLENSLGPPLTSFRIAMQGQSNGGARGGPAGVALDASGMFDIKEIPPGRYNFALSGGQSGAYFKRVVCGGRDSTIQPLSVETSATLSDCSITIAMDAGTLSGQVLDGSNPVPGLTVVAIPQARDLRQVARYTMTATTDANGKYVIPGVIPGDYYMFAVLPDEELSYFSSDYADRNQSTAELVNLKSGESKSVNLKPSAPQ